MSRTGILLVNTGTPASPEVPAVRGYLRQFLSDPRVIDMHPLWRWLLLHLVILPFRSPKSAEAYRKIWTPQGSPLLVHGQGLAQRLQHELGPSASVQLAMQYGQPSIAAGLDALLAEGVSRVIAVPLFPHYASASYGAAAAAVLQEVSTRWTLPAVHVVEPFWHQPEFLDLQVARLRAAIEREQPDHVLFSYHGLPERHCRRTDTTGRHCLQSDHCCANLVDANRHCYRAQCHATTQALATQLGLPRGAWSTAFQSRLGRTPWIQPHTDLMLGDLGQRKLGKVLVAEPSFVADCLETLEEIGMRGRDDFRAAGGGELVLVPSLNQDPAWAQALATIVRRSCPGWLAN